MKRRIGFFQGKSLVIGDPNIVTGNEILVKKQKDDKVELSYRNNGVLQNITGSSGKDNFPEDYMITIQGYDANSERPRITERFCCKQNDGILYAIEEYDYYSESPAPTGEIGKETRYRPYSYLYRSSTTSITGYSSIVLSGSENNKILNSIDKVYSASIKGTSQGASSVRPHNISKWSESGSTYIKVYNYPGNMLIAANKDNKVVFMYMLSIQGWYSMNDSDFTENITTVLKDAGLEIDYNIDYQ